MTLVLSLFVLPKTYAALVQCGMATTVHLGGQVGPDKRRHRHQVGINTCNMGLPAFEMLGLYAMPAE